MPYYGWNPIIFILVVACIAVLHDLAFYYLVVLPIPQGHNAMIDMYKVYAKENGSQIILGDTLLMIASALVTFALKYMPNYVSTILGVLTVYTLPYILNTPEQYK